jgi:hypothetical protein
MTTDRWRCTICGAVLGASAPPAHCPECGARDAMFVATEEPPHGLEHNPMQPRDERDTGAFSVGPGTGCIEEG